MIKYRIVVYTDYRNADGYYYKTIFESEYYQECVDKYNSLKEAIEQEYKMTLRSSDLYDKDTCTNKHYFQLEMLSQQFEHGEWRGLATSVKGALEKYIGEYHF